MWSVSRNKAERLAGWGCGCNLVMDCVFDACQHSLFSAGGYTPICVPLTSPTILKLETTISIWYIVDAIVAQASLCILFHLYLDTGGVSCIPSTAYIRMPIAHRSLSPMRGTWPIPRPLCNLPCCLSSILRICGDFFQGRRSSASSPYGAFPIVWWRWCSVLIGCEQGLLHTYLDSGFSRTSVPL